MRRRRGRDTVALLRVWRRAPDRRVARRRPDAALVQCGSVRG